MKPSEELTKETKLVELFFAWRILAHQKSQLTIIAVAIVAGFLVSLISAKSHVEIASDSRSLFWVLFNFAATILGFAVAGFALFASAAKPGLFRGMIKVLDKRTGLNYLRLTLLTFGSTFSHIVVLAGFAIGFEVIFPAGGLFSLIVREIGTPMLLKKLLASIIYGISVGMLVHLLQQVCVLTFNIYHAVSATIRWDIENHSPSHSDGSTPVEHENPPGAISQN